MTLPEALLANGAYPQEVRSVTLIETHMSWVFLTGEYAYKVKKPVTFDFVDFHTLAERERFCRRELELNRRFAPDLYVDVVPVVRAADGREVIDPGRAGPVVDWAVKMIQFPVDQTADVLLNERRLTAADLHRFGAKLARQHARLPVASGAPIGEAALENFTTIARVDLPAGLGEVLASLEANTVADLARHAARLADRANSGHVRACHGDLHLANLVMRDDGITAFDCLEFSDALSVIDVWADVAFLYMDLCTRGHDDLAHAFVDGYLGESGDFDGALLLALFARYRAMVRAKVRALRYTQAATAALRDEISTYVSWAAAHSTRPCGSIIVTHGLSGSGKSFWSEQLVVALGCVRIRSDVLRKVTLGLGVRERSSSPIAGGIYASSTSRPIYDRMAALAVDLAREGERVIIDAACLHRWQRDVLTQAAARAGVAVRLVSFVAPTETLKERIRHRRARGNDPSESDEDVLEWQMANADPVVDAEAAFIFDTERGELGELVAAVR